MFRIIMFVLATALLAWRLVYPVQSYGVLFNTVNSVSNYAIGNQWLLAVKLDSFLTLVLVDQFNGFVIGIVFTTGLALAGKGLWRMGQGIAALIRGKSAKTSKSRPHTRADNRLQQELGEELIRELDLVSIKGTAKGAGGPATGRQAAARPPQRKEPGF